MKTVATFLLLMTLAVAGVLGQGTASPEVQLKAAIHKEQVEGDLKGAAELFKALAQNPTRTVAAQALVHLGQCYEKLGDAQARAAVSAFERVVNEFTDQKDAVAEARRHLSSRAAAAPDTALAEREVWTLPEFVEGGRLSSDGRTLAFVDWGKKPVFPGTPSGRAVGLRDLVTGESRVVAESTQCFDAVRSPDGKLVSCAWNGPSGTHGIRILPADGSPGRTLFSGTQDASVADWSPDGTSVLARVRREAAYDLVLIAVADGSIRVVKAGGGVGQFRTIPRFSPDGRYVVHAATPPGADGNRTATTLHVTSLADGSEVALIRDGVTETDWNPVWTADGGRIAFLSDRSGVPAIWAVRVLNGKPQGDPEMLNSEAGETSLLGFARDGTLYCQRNRSLVDVYVTEVDVEGGKILSAPTRVNQGFVGRSNGPMAWSPDGRTLAFSRADALKRSVVVHGMDTGKEQELTQSPSTVVGWFPDGQALLAGAPFSRVRVETGQAQAIPGLERVSIGNFGTAITLSHDGKTFFYSVSDNDATKNDGVYTVRLMRHRLDTGEAQEIYRTASAMPSLHSLVVSPDDRLIAFGERQGAGSVVKVLPVEGGAARVVYTQSAWGVAWSRDGRFLLVRGIVNGDVQLLSVPLDGSEPRQTGFQLGIQMALSPDGRHLAFITGQDRSTVVAIKNLLADHRSAVSR